MDRVLNEATRDFWETGRSIKRIIDHELRSWHEFFDHLSLPGYVNALGMSEAADGRMKHRSLPSLMKNARKNLLFFRVNYILINVYVSVTFSLLVNARLLILVILGFLLGIHLLQLHRSHSVEVFGFEIAFYSRFVVFVVSTLLLVTILQIFLATFASTAIWASIVVIHLVIRRQDHSNADQARARVDVDYVGIVDRSGPATSFRPRNLEDPNESTYSQEENLSGEYERLRQRSSDYAKWRTAKVARR